jgi:hypothetical protein
VRRFRGAGRVHSCFVRLSPRAALAMAERVQSEFFRVSIGEMRQDGKVNSFSAKAALYGPSPSLTSQRPISDCSAGAPFPSFGSKASGFRR